MIEWLLLVAVLSIIVKGEECQPTCYNGDYHECPFNSSARMSTESVHIKLVTPSFLNWRDIFLQTVMVLLCEEVAADTHQPCWTVHMEGNVDCEFPCNCSSVELSVFLDNSTAVPACTLTALLDKASSKLSLRLFGFSLLEVMSAETAETTSALFGVPIASWVCVGVGVVLSISLFSKPLWWACLQACSAWVVQKTVRTHK